MNELLLQVPLLDIPWKIFALLVITSLAGGAFGAAIGALPAFIFTGFVVFLGEGLAVLRRALVGGVDVVSAGEFAAGITGVIGFGAITGPHIAFAGGVAASAYAGKKYPEMNPAEGGYHFGKDITYAFGTKPDILAVGAIFGLVGMLITRVLGAVVVIGGTAPTDFIAVSVFATAFLARAAFDYPVVGKPAGKGLLDMSPFERGEDHPKADSNGEHAGRPATEPWLPHQYKWSGVTVIGLVGGILGGYIWLRTGSIFMGYGISAISLLFLNLGVEKIPVTHHITLLGSVGAVVVATAFGDLGAATFPVEALGATGAVAALLAAGVFGALSGLVGEVTQRMFYSHSGTHVDPPAMAIAIMMLVVGILSIVGVLPSAGYL